MEYCVHIYEGDGKGKTTAAMGLAVRSAGSGNKVTVTQFLKGLPTGELVSFEKLGVEVYRTKTVETFIFLMNEQELEITRKDCLNLLNHAKEAIENGSSLLIMDEVIDAVNCKMVMLEELFNILDLAKGKCEIVMTGRNPLPEIVERADYYTKMTAVKHPYNRGLAGRKGVEF